MSNQIAILLAVLLFPGGVFALALGLAMKGVAAGCPAGAPLTTMSEAWMRSENRCAAARDSSLRQHDASAPSVTAGRRQAPGRGAI